MAKNPTTPIRPVSHFRLRPGERRTLLLIGDLLMASTSLLLALYFWASGDPWLDFSLEFLRRVPAWFYLLPLFWIGLLVELYDDQRASNWQVTLRGIANAAIIGIIVYMIVYFGSDAKLPRRGVAGFVVAASVLTLLWRFFYIRVFTAPQFVHRVLLVGGGETGRIIMKLIKGALPPPYYLIGIIDDDPEKIGVEIEGYPVLGGSDRLLDIINQQDISEVIVAISGQMLGQMFQALLDAQERGIEITRMPVAYQELLDRIPIRYLEADWILRSFVDQARVNHFYEMMKRLTDILGGLVGVGITLLTFPFIAVAIVLDSGFPILYSQIRSGRGGQPYKIIKYRTMKQDAEADGLPQWAEESDPRATRIGRILRKTHIDELPQFINVVSGEMSLVGPRAERPELVAWFQQHVPFYRARLLVKPGITGWAQVNFGYASTIDETIIKLEYDLYYILRRNLWLDLMIVLRTPATVLGLQGR
jgi:exopolysaccharide biosynthesis polyprenyl glycosylphosphotransferase